MSFFNEGNTDRAIRIVLGLGLLSIVFFGPQTPWGWIGLVPLLAAVLPIRSWASIPANSGKTRICNSLTSGCDAR